MPNAAEVLALAEVLYSGGLTPAGVTRPVHIAARIIAGREVGLSAVQAVNGIMFVNGRATIWGDAALALVRASGLLEAFDERVEGAGDERAAVCVARRAGDAAAKTVRWKVADAKKAGLWGKKGPWTEYPDRMLVMRARAWMLRDLFTDVLCGLWVYEEARDIPGAKVDVEVVEAVADAPTISPPPALPAASPAERLAAFPAAVTVGQPALDRIATARPGWLRSVGVNPDDRERVGVVWREHLRKRFGVDTAKHLAPDQGDTLIRDMEFSARQAVEAAEVFGPGEAKPAECPFGGGDIPPPPPGTDVGGE